MTKPWYYDEVCNLAKFSDKKYKTRIPYAEEVLKLNDFIFEMRMLFSKKDTAKLIAPTENRHFLIRVFHIGRSIPMEIDLPEDAVWEVVHKTAQILNDRCDDLTELCGYERKEGEK